MILIQLFVAFVCIFMSGANYAAWDLTGTMRNLYISLFIGLVGFGDLISLVGLTVQVAR